MKRIFENLFMRGTALQFSQSCLEVNGFLRPTYVGWVFLEFSFRANVRSLVVDNEVVGFPGEMDFPAF
jgi:hypothetical protein